MTEPALPRFAEVTEKLLEAADLTMEDLRAARAALDTVAARVLEEEHARAFARYVSAAENHGFVVKALAYVQGFARG